MACVLTASAKDHVIPCQIERCGATTVLHWMLSRLSAGETQDMVVRTVRVQPQQARMRAVDNPDRSQVVFLDKGRLFSAYHYGEQWARPFLYPMLGPGNAPLTRAWPMANDEDGASEDHPHHKSVWVGYGECGREDHWSEEPGHGTQRHETFLALESGEVYARVCARISWRTASGREQFREIRDMRFYAMPGGQRLADFQVTFESHRASVRFGDTKEGGLISFRVSPSMEVQHGGRIENAFGGVNEEETWGKPAPWCDYSGESAGRRVGLAVFDHPSNPRHPTQWHVRNYGLMTANCFAWSHYAPEAGIRGDMMLLRGRQYPWRYRFYCHKGDARQGGVRQQYLAYAFPPSVRWKNQHQT